MLNKIFVLFLSILLVMPLSAMATDTSTGTFSLLKKGDKAPFEGILLDPYATGTVLSESDSNKEKYDLNLKFETDKLKAQHKLELDNLQISLKTTQDSSKAIIDSKDKELKELQNIALHSNDNTWLYIGGGTLVGIMLTLGVLWASGHVTSK